MTRHRITTAGLYFLTAAAFVLSFDALRQLAFNSGVNWWLSWLYPLTLDAVAIVAALYIVRMTETGDGKKYAWFLTVLFAVLSIAGNVLHIDTGAAWYQGVKPVLPYVVMSVPPIALVLSFHLFTLQLENDIRRAQPVTPVKVTDKPVSVKPVTIETVKPEPVVKPVKALPVADVKPVGDKQAAMLAYLAEHPAATVTEAAQVVEVSRQTATGYVKQLTEAGRLNKNGHGWEVLR